MNDAMFCFQCGQTAGGKGCTRVGVCGKQPEVAGDQDRLTAALIRLARAAEGKTPTQTMNDLVMQGLFATVTNVNFDHTRFETMIRQVEAETQKLGGAAALAGALSTTTHSVSMSPLRIRLP